MLLVMAGNIGAVRAEDVVVGAFTSLENEYYVDWNKGAQEAAEALGVTYRALVDNNSTPKQIEIYETQLQQGVKMFFGTSPFTTNIPLIVEMVKAFDAYYVGFWDCVPWYHPLDAGGMNYAAYFAPDDFQNGYLLAKMMFEKMGGKGNVVHISGWPGSSVDVQRTMGLEKALKEFPNIALVGSKPGKWNQIDARQAMEELISALPPDTKIDGVFAQNDSEADGVLEVCQEIGLKVPVIGFDGNAKAIQQIKEGKMLATAAYMPGWQAGYAMVRAYDVMRGWKPTPMERMMFTGAVLVTQANVAQYEAAIYGGAKLPFDWKKMSRVLHPDDWDPQNAIWPMDVEALWNYALDKKPEGYALPEAYRAALANGELESIRQLYQTHYQKHLVE